MVNRVRFLPPRVNPEAIARPLVQQQLRAAGDLPLTLIVAPPGFGKTTALATWLGTHPDGAVYFAAVPRDGDLARFVTLLVAGIQTIVPAIGAATLEELNNTESPDGVTLAESLADELAAAAQEVTVVIDDLHAISTSEVHTLLGELLRLEPPTLHLVLASRHDPPLPWARLRLEGRLHEIRARDLQLSKPQAGLVLQRAGVSDPAGRVADIVWRQAEGWPAGVRALTLGLKEAPTPLSGDALASGAIFSYIDDFLVQEVFTQQSPEVRDALLRLAVFARFDGDLAQALLADTVPGKTRALLAELMTACPYLEPEDHADWVRFHPLFRQFLRNEYARRYREADRRQLSHRAGALLAARGLQPFAPDERMQRILTRAAETGRAMAAGIAFRHNPPERMVWPDRQYILPFVGGSPSFEVNGQALHNARTAFFYLACGASQNMASQTPGQGQAYPSLLMDKAGDYFDGGKTYRMHIPAPVPAKLYWSVTLYDTVTRSLLDIGTPASRISSFTRPVANDDGSYDLYFGPEVIAGKEANSIVTPAGRGWFFLFRLYGPEEAYFDGSWKLDDVVEVVA